MKIKLTTTEVEEMSARCGFECQKDFSCHKCPDEFVCPFWTTVLREYPDNWDEKSIKKIKDYE